jgi:hypothetical protein
MTKTYIVTAGSNSTDLGVVGYCDSILGAKRIGRKAVNDAIPGGDGGYRVKDKSGNVVFGGERSIRTGFRWIES